MCDELSKKRDAATRAAEGGDMTEVKIVMDDYGLLYAVLPDGSKRKIRADTYGNPFYGIVQVGKEPKEET